jgi:hypothetical protein
MWKFKYVAIVLCIYFQSTLSFTYSFEDALNLFSNSEEIFEKLKRTTPIQNKNSEKDALCDEHFRVFIDGLNKAEDWATRSNFAKQYDVHTHYNNLFLLPTVFDSWGKLPSGLFYGNTMSLGNYDQCMSIQHSFLSSFSTPSLLTGQVCLMPMIKQSQSHLYGNIDIKKSIIKLKANHDAYIQKDAKNYIGNAPPFVAGVCVPAVCDPKRVPLLLNEFLQQFNYSVPLFDPTEVCESNKLPTLRAIDWVAVILFGLFGCLLISSTIYDVGMQKTKSMFLKWCLDDIKFS